MSKYDWQYNNGALFFIFPDKYSGTYVYPVILYRCIITDDVMFISV
jgi:hypothetical protein